MNVPIASLSNPRLQNRHPTKRTAPAMPKRKRLFRFGLKLMLVTVAFACFLLARHYPRMHYSVSVDCVPNGGDALTYAKLAKSKAVLQRVYDAHPEFHRGGSPDAAIAFLRDEFDSYVTDNRTVKIVAYGKPKDEEELAAIVDAVSNKLVEFLSESDPSLRTVRLIPSTTSGL